MSRFDTMETKHPRAVDIALESSYIALSKALDDGNTEEAERIAAIIGLVKQR